MHTTAWTGSPSIRPFIPADVAKKSAAKIEKWAENYLIKLFDLAVELGVKILPTFWGVAFGWEVASGYPWGFWAGGDFDLIKEGQERFVKKTAKIRKAANDRGIVPRATRSIPAPRAMCADDFNMLVSICDGDKCLARERRPEPLLGRRELGDAASSRSARASMPRTSRTSSSGPGMPLRMMNGNWPQRAMQFVDLPSGDINMQRYAELLVQIGYPARYNQVMGRADRAAGGRSRERPQGPRLHQRQRHRLRARQPLLARRRRFLRRRHGRLTRSPRSLSRRTRGAPRRPVCSAPTEPGRMARTTG